MFDDSASKIIGKTALEMATIKEESEINYRKVLNSAKYRQFNFLVKTSMESWNDEQRLKMSVANAELVNYKDEKHVKRLKAEIEALKTEKWKKKCFTNQDGNSLLSFYLFSYTNRPLYFCFLWPQNNIWILTKFTSNFFFGFFNHVSEMHSFELFQFLSPFYVLE